MSIDKIKTGDDLTQSLDIVSDNISKLKELFPEVLTEGKIDFKVLQDILGNESEEEEEFYRFTWAGKSQSRREAHKPSTGTLRPCKEESLDWDTTQNLYIEGDNLEVLKLLQKSYSNMVSMIYIDPPYNTGKDFVYKDNYKDNLKNYQQVTGQVDSEGNKMSTNTESDGRYHSNWLNMIYPRLRLARNLLKEDGVIFMSIDDNEVENLKKVSHEIFGEENFIGSMIWKKTENIKMDSKYFSVNKDFVLCYKKNNKSEFNKEISDILRFNLTDEKGKYYLRKLDSRSSSYSRSLDYVIENDGVKYYAGGDYDDYLKRQEKGANKKDCIWLWSKSKFEQGLIDNEIVFKNGNVYNKVRFDGLAKKPYIDILDVPSGQSSQKSLNKLFDDKRMFDYPKPTELIEHFIKLIDNGNKNDLILDFFSGSATTGHSVFNLNSSDNGNRKFILVQLPEKSPEDSESFNVGYKTISEIGKERLRRAGKKIKEENPLHSGDLDLGFKVFKLDSSNIKGWDGLPDNLENSLFESQDNIKSDRKEEDVLFEILLKYGLDLTLPIEEKVIEGKKVFNVGFGALFICLGNELTSKVAEGIGQWKETLKPETCRVIFKDGGFTDVEKTNSVQTLKRFGIQEIKSI
jgi:adenine-specific DNA-methyltransferase